DADRPAAHLHIAARPSGRVVSGKCSARDFQRKRRVQRRPVHSDDHSSAGGDEFREAGRRAVHPYKENAMKKSILLATLMLAAASSMSGQNCNFNPAPGNAAFGNYSVFPSGS